MIDVKASTGKLVALRICSPITYPQATMLRPRMDAVFRVMLPPVCLVADLSDARVYSPDVAEKILDALRAASSTVQRMGVWVNSSSALGAHIFQVFREAGDLDRQAWIQCDGMVEHLSKVLSLAEQEALRGFLAEQPVGACA